MSLAPNDSRHGTHNGYNNLGCRCDRCREAATVWLRAYRHRTGRNKPFAEYAAEKRAEAEARDNHGTESRYKRCRCELCRAAAREAKRRRREQSRQPCVHGCGRLVVTINRDYPDKPLECLPCALKRVNAARRKTAA